MVFSVSRQPDIRQCFSLSRLFRSLLSLMPEKEAKRASRNRNPCDACHRTSRRKRLAQGHPNIPAVFSTRASFLAPIAADCEDSSHLVLDIYRNRRVRGREGFNRRVSISVPERNLKTFQHHCAPKLLACAVGIESVRYDFPKGVLWTRDFSRF